MSRTFYTDTENIKQIELPKTLIDKIMRHENVYDEGDGFSVKE